MFDIGWTEILILATVSLFVIGPKEIPKFLGFIGKMLAKVRGISRELQDSVDDAIKNSELEDIRKEISFTDPELSKNFNEIINPSLNKTKEDEDDSSESMPNEELNTNKLHQNKSAEKPKLTKKNLPTGLKHIKSDSSNDALDKVKKSES
mgnify:CR=1 FL=1|tara:strand:- start:672 stop:1121 length:450 start_codon:yes stop_codon:yes gene_type:complete